MSEDQQGKPTSSSPLHSIHGPDSRFEDYFLSAFLEDSRVPALAPWQHSAFRDAQPGLPRSIPISNDASQTPRVNLPQRDIAQAHIQPKRNPATKPRPVAPQSIPIFTEARQPPRFQLPETDLRQSNPEKQTNSNRRSKSRPVLPHSIPVYVEDRRRPQVNFPGNDQRQVAVSQVDAEDLIKDFAAHNFLPPNGKRRSQPIWEEGRAAKKRRKA